MKLAELNYHDGELERVALANLNSELRSEVLRLRTAISRALDALYGEMQPWIPDSLAVGLLERALEVDDGN